MSERIETTAIRNLIHNEEYCRKVLPFIKEEYFTDRLEKLLFTEIYKFVNKYNNLPTKESLSIEINTNKGITEDEYKKLTGIIAELNPEPINLDWLVETTQSSFKLFSIASAKSLSDSFSSVGLVGFSETSDFEISRFKVVGRSNFSFDSFSAVS